MNRFDELVEGYRPQSDKELSNAQREVMQKVALAGLCRGGFFKHAAFYGGTCLRIFHKLMRYSEDMDFSLIEKDESVHIENYFQPIVDEFKAIGMPVEIVKVCKASCAFGFLSFEREDTGV